MSATDNLSEFSLDDFQVNGRFLKTAHYRDEWYSDIPDLPAAIQGLRACRPKIDILRFWERVPNTEPRDGFYHEREGLAVLPVSDYDNWWTKQINAKTRNRVRKGEKLGLSVIKATLDDQFAEGMAHIFAESPVRQGRRFWHYGKSSAQIKEEFSRFLFREDIYGAYFEGRLVGYLFVAWADRYAVLPQIISTMEHRYLSPTNALMAAAVKACAEKGVPYLIYARWPEGPLADFKRHNGFTRVDVPTYYVPLTARGRIAIALRLHRGIRPMLGPRFRDFARTVRANFLSRQAERGD
jgi:hypothetical protein